MLNGLLRNRVLMVLLAVLVIGGVLFALNVRMAKSDLHVSAAAEALTCLGGGEPEHGLCATGIPFTNAVLMTLLVDVALILTMLSVRSMQLVPRGFQNVIEATVEALYNFAVGIDRKNVAKFFALPATIFMFFLYANFFALVPGVGSIGLCEVEKPAAAAEGHAAEGAAPAAEGHAGEAQANNTVFVSWPLHCGGTVVPFFRAPAADLNVTFAFALVAMFMVEFFGFQALGFSYLTKFFNFREGFLGFFVGIIEIISEFSRIISFAFRIFGNIFGGEVILLVMSYLFPYLLPLPFYGFEVFVAFMQAIIFAILTLIFFSTAVIGHASHDEEGHDVGTVQVESDVAPHAAH
ncbi:F0F1 ATP synthase subunit A [Chloroflexia bacterium SDU3-3]|nr:F0F1 ATP synthase subunit A [Chloroflexia bacterium SDU3-3]